MPKISEYTSRALSTSDEVIVRNGATNARVPIGAEMDNLVNRIDVLEGGGVTTHKTLWLSPDAIPAGTSQTGSRENPLDASTPTLLNAVYAANTSDVTFQYMAGTYETWGWQYNTTQNAGNNTAHIGAGMGVSTLQLVNASGASASTDGVIIGNNYDTVVSNVQIKGLTLDVNAVNNAAFTGGVGALTAINVYGNKVRVADCEIIGFGTGSSAECFPVYVGRTRDTATTEQLGANVVENCLVHSQAPGSSGPVTCIIVGTQGAGSNLGLFLRTDIVRGCQFYNLPRPAGGHAVHGVTAPIIEDCIFDGIDDPVYWEPQGPPATRVDYDHFVLKGCVFRDYKFAVVLRQSAPVSVVKSLVIRDNFFYSRAGTHRTEGVAIALLTAVTDPNLAIERIVIENNSAMHMDGSIGVSGLAGGTCFLWGYPEAGGLKICKNIVIRNNMIDLRDGVYLSLNDVSPQATSFVNETISGNVMADGTSMDTNLSLAVL